MRMPRIRLWLLMVVVVLAASLAAGWAWETKARRLAKIAARREREEAVFREVLAGYRKQNRALAEMIDSLGDDPEPDRPNVGDIQAEIGLMHRQMVNNEEYIRSYQQLADSAHASAVTYRKAARYPWLRVRLVEPTSHLFDEQE
jgi:hypothetical protein